MPIDPRKVLRLNLPQWQGGDRSPYRIGARILTALAPEAQGPEDAVPVPQAAAAERPLEHRILSRVALRRQADAALAVIDRHAPDAIVTLDGDCHIDFAPIACLSEKHGDDLAVLWVDAHPDIQGPAQTSSAHAHFVAMMMGEGDEVFSRLLRRPIEPRQVLYVGLTETSPFETGFIRDHNIGRLSPEDLAGSPEKVLEWSRNSGASKVAVHFDVVDPSLYGFLLFRCPDAAPGTRDDVPRGRMTFGEVARILHAVDAEADTVGLAITEFLPWDATLLSQSLSTPPLPGTENKKLLCRLSISIMGNER
ncbi:MAG: arginase family protein [Acetobacteraceae bacterium]